MCTLRLDARCARFVAVAVALLLWAAPARAGLSQDWYLYRARANLAIRNYSAAIEAFRKVLEDAPHHREALRGLAMAFEKNGQTDEAVATYDRYLEQHTDDPEIAFHQAANLQWSRYAYRRKDAIRYYRIGLAHDDDPAQRRKLARLLGQDRADLDDALVEYRRLVKANPSDRQLAAEYRKLLLWDDRHLDEAIAVHRDLVQERPGDRALALQYANLLARSPRHAGAAAKAYAQLLEGTPRDRKLRLAYARVLAKDPDRSREAADQLRMATGGSWNYENRLLYADLRAANADGREEALEHYRVLLAQRPKNTAVRLEYARLLGAQKSNNDQAIAEYEKVLHQQPENGAAHAGLAHALAWKGDSDRALHHERLATRHGVKGERLATLERDLAAGREPRSGGGLELIAQPGTTFDLYGLRVPLAGRMDVSPFFTTSVSAGSETFFGGPGGTATGAFFSAESELRPSRTDALRLELGYHTVRSGAAGLRGRAEWIHRADAVLLRPRLERQPRQDSLQSLVTHAVHSNVAALRLEHHTKTSRMWLDPQAGFAAGTGGDANLLLAVDGAAEREVLAWTGWSLWLGWESRLSHHGFDATASEGYFSPALFVSQTPLVFLRTNGDGPHSLDLGAGPSLQYERLHGGSDTLMPGAQVRAASHLRITPNLAFSAGAAFNRVGNAYLRFDTGGMLSYLF